MPAGRNPEALSGRAFEGDVDRAIRKTLASGGLGHLVTQDRSHRTIDVADRDGGANRLTGLQRRPADLINSWSSASAIP